MTTRTAAAKFYTAALTLELVDAVDLVQLGAAHGTDPADVLEALDDAASALQHCNPTKRAAWIALRDAAAWFAGPIASEAPDRFGFQAQARATAEAAYTAAGVSW